MEEEERRREEGRERGGREAVREREKGSECVDVMWLEWETGSCTQAVTCRKAKSKEKEEEKEKKEKEEEEGEELEMSD